MPLTQVRFPVTAKYFSPGVSFQCRLSHGARTPPCAIACIYICTHDKDPVVLCCASEVSINSLLCCKSLNLKKKSKKKKTRRKEKLRLVLSLCVFATGAGCSSVGRASDPASGWRRFDSPMRQADSLTVSVHPRMQSHALTSVCTLKIL